MEWTKEFYRTQGEWGDVFKGDPTSWHHYYAERLSSYMPAAARILELGSGGGQLALALAARGHEVLAIELVEEMAEHAKKLSQTPTSGSVTAIQGDFYEIEVTGTFDAVVYHDGFGVGEDEDQRRLLRRISTWLRRDGVALIDIYTPWYWARHAGRTGMIGRAQRRYDFDPIGSRMLDFWSADGKEIMQSLRCYSPADLTLLLDSTGLRLAEVIPTGGYDYERSVMDYEANLSGSMSYLAVLVPHI